MVRQIGDKYVKPNDRWLEGLGRDLPFFLHNDSRRACRASDEPDSGKLRALIGH